MTARAALLLALLAAAYVGVLAHFSPLPLQDFPNHLARAVVMADLIFDHGRVFGSAFSFHFQLAPYILGDLVLAGAVKLFGASAASALWCVLTFLSLPAALGLYLRALRVPPDAEFLLLGLSLYFATDAFFALGFLSFRLGVAFVLIALALAEWLRQMPSRKRYALFVLVVVAGYLVHLAMIVFLAAALAVSALVRLRFRTTTLRQETGLFAPVAAVLVWHFLGASRYRDANDVVSEVYAWGTPLTKAVNLFWDLRRYRPTWDVLTGALALACLASTYQPLRRAKLAQPAVLELWALTLTFLSLYLLLPYTSAQAAFVDVRALALLPIFLILALATMRQDPVTAAPLRPALLVLTASLGIVNLVYLFRELGETSTWLKSYRTLMASVPEGSRVMPVYTAPKEGGIRPLLHVAEFLVIDRGAMTPYLFSGDTGAPMTYFRYRHRPYAPDEEWYTRHLDGVDWQRVADTYQFVLVMKPFDFQRIAAHPVSITSNRAASLLNLSPPLHP